jgi:hypothetical protein
MHLVADHQVAAAERLVELHPVVAAAELTARLDADARLAPRVDLGAAALGCSVIGFVTPVQGQVAGDVVDGLVDLLNLRRLEGDVR